MKISVLMPVTVEPYSYSGNLGKMVFSAKDPEIKFIRAVNSFLEQSHPDKELIVVHDGCIKSQQILHIQFKEYIESGLIKSFLIPKQSLFSGLVRQKGAENATGEIICYIDYDDQFTKKHLAFIDANFHPEKNDWVYYNDFLLLNPNVNGMPQYGKRIVTPEIARIGTSSFAHKRSIPLKWADGFCHDWLTIEKYLINKKLPCSHIGDSGYIVCHIAQSELDN